MQNCFITVHERSTNQVENHALSIGSPSVRICVSRSEHIMLIGHKLNKYSHDIPKFVEETQFFPSYVV